MNYNDYATPQIVAIKLAQMIQEKVAALPEGRLFYMALSGGSDYVEVYKILAQEPFSNAIDWSRLRFFFVYEEIGASTTHYQEAEEYLFAPLGIGEDQIFRIDATTEDPAQEALRYAQVVREQVPHLDGSPRFDFTLLELKPKGQTAGICPRQMDLFVDESVYIANQNPEDDTRYVTLTLHALESSKNLVFLALGPDSRYAIGDIVNLDPSAKDYPANFLAARCPWIHLFADKQAMRERSYSIY